MVCQKRWRFSLDVIGAHPRSLATQIYAMDMAEETVTVSLMIADPTGTPECLGDAMAKTTVSVPAVAGALQVGRSLS